MEKRDLEIVAAGHTCLDLIPAFTIDGKVDKMTDVLVPGKMINMGECVVVGGGPVTNAGVSIFAGREDLKPVAWNLVDHLELP